MVGNRSRKRGSRKLPKLQASGLRSPERTQLRFGIVVLRANPAQIAFGGSRNGCFCIRKNVRLPPAAINLLE